MVVWHTWRCAHNHNPFNVSLSALLGRGDNLPRRMTHNWVDMGNEFEECQSVSKLFKQIKDWGVTFDIEIAPDDRIYSQRPCI